MYTLRPYQTEAIGAILNDFERVSNTLLVLPVGAGKTLVFSTIAMGWDAGNVLVLAHTDELISQACDRLEKVVGYYPQIEKAQYHAEPHQLGRWYNIVVSSMQTMSRPQRLERFRRHPFGLIIIDEAHRAANNSYRRIVQFYRNLNPNLKVLGVTATPMRSDNTSLGVVFESVAYQLDIHTAINQGWLVPIAQEYIQVKNLDFSGVKTQTSKATGESDFVDYQLEAVLNEEKVLHEMAIPVLEKTGDDRQAIIFTAGIDHADAFAALLRRYKPRSAHSIHSRTNKEHRPYIIEEFAKGKVQYLVNVGVLTEGYDAPNASVIVMARPTKSVGRYVQCLGRGTRPLPGVVDGLATADERKAAIAASAKKSMLILDFVGNSRLKIVSAVDALAGNYEVEAVEQAKQSLATKQGNVLEELEKAQSSIISAREELKRRHIKALRAEYEARQVNPFDYGDNGYVGTKPVITRGGSTDAQIELLLKFEVSRETAAGYSKVQASVVIDKLRRTRCTIRQAAILKQYDEEPKKFNFAQASAVIDEIAKAGWKPRAKKQQQEILA